MGSLGAGAEDGVFPCSQKSKLATIATMVQIQPPLLVPQQHTQYSSTSEVGESGLYADLTLPMRVLVCVCGGGVESVFDSPPPPQKKKKC